MIAKHKIDIGEAIGIVGSVFRLVATCKARVEAAKADGTVTPAEVVALVKAAIDDATDGLAEQIVTALED